MMSQTHHHSNPNPNPNHHHLHVSREKLQDPTTKRITMKDFSFCSRDGAVRVADMGCSRSSSVINRYSFAGSNKGQPNIGSVTSTYVSRLSSQKEVLIQLTWSRNNDGLILTVQMDDHLCSTSYRKTSSRAVSIQLSQEKKGNWTFTRGSCTVHLYWDMTFAVYSAASPEPTSGFYVVVYVNSEFVLLLGEIRKGNSNPLDRHGTEPSAQTCMISRTEQVQYVGTSYTTKARFHPADKDHKICVNFEPDKQVLSVNVDDKPAVHVTKLKWNFRGSQTIFFEKTMVDIMWNLHGWLCDQEDDGGGGGGARVARNVNAAWFMFRARSSLDEWLWQVEDQGAMSHRSSIFTIEAFKRQ